MRACSRRAAGFGGMLLIVAAACGCSFQEALADGFYGGISDTVAAIISGLLLGAAP